MLLTAEMVACRTAPGMWSMLDQFVKIWHLKQSLVEIVTCFI